MKVCGRLVDGTQIYKTDGSVRLCAWLYGPYHEVGKLTETTMEEMWKSDKVKHIFERLDAGDYSICNPSDCPYLASADGKLDKVEMIEIDEIPKHTTHLNISFEKNCNYRCKICAETTMGNFDGVNPLTEENRKKIMKNLEPALPYLVRVGANGAGELMASPFTLELLSKWDPIDKEHAHVRLESNGSLFDAEHWKKIENLGQYPITLIVTVMSFEQKTYEFLHGVKYPIQRVVDNLHFIKSLRDKGIINHFEITNVMQERNFRELPSWFKRCVEEFDPDSVRIRPYSPYGFNPPNEWVYDIRGKNHPYHSEYLEMIKDPIFKHPKFNDWGVFYSHEHPIPYLEEKNCRRWESEILCKLLDDDSDLDKLVDMLKENDGKLIVHGAGVLGRTIVKHLLERGKVKVEFISDFKQEGEFLGVPIVNINEEEFRKSDKYDKTLPMLITWLETKPRNYDYIRNFLGMEGKFIELKEIFGYDCDCGCDCK